MTKNNARIRRATKSRANMAYLGKTRLSIHRSNTNIYAQVIDDVNGVTLAAASSVEKGNKLANGGNIEAAKVVGKLIAERALKQNIESVVFDRSGYLYHGRVKALADAAREAGLKF